MKKILYVAALFTIMAFLAGCVTVKKVVRERVDQGLDGNRGYIAGSAPMAAAEPKPTQREYIDVRVEFPMWQELKEKMPKPKKRKRRKESRLDKDTSSGNRGYMMGDVQKRETRRMYMPTVTEEVVEAKTSMPTSEPTEVAPSVSEEESIYEEGPALSEEVIISEEEIPLTPTTYIVREGDSLSGIAQKLYGKASKWYLIYEANMDKIEAPDSIKAGTELIIPELEEETIPVK